MKKKKYTTCSGCGRLRLEDELVCENEELWRENPGIRFNGVGPAFRFVRVKSQNVLLCKRCRRLRRISGFVSLIAAGLFGWLLYYLTTTIGKELEFLWGILWLSGSFIYAGLLIGRLFQILTRCETKWTGNKRYHKEGREQKCCTCGGAGYGYNLFFQGICPRCKGKGTYIEHYW